MTLTERQKKGGYMIAWAERWGIPHEALRELYTICNAPLVNTNPSPLSEAAVQVDVRLEASKAGEILWRNNVGVMKDERGVPVRYGLANESKKMNETVKSSDLIGIRPLLIEQKHVGTVVGQFLAREVKHGGWSFNPKNSHENAQLKFLTIVNSLGGDGKFVNSGRSLLT